MPYLSLRVLVIEERPFKRLIATRIFQNLGCDEVMAVADSADALELLKHIGPVDIVLCSLKLDCTQGLTVIQDLSRAGLAHSIIICSVHPSDLHSAIERMLSMHGVAVLGFVDTLVSSHAITLLMKRFVEMENIQGNDVSRPACFNTSSKLELKQAIKCNEFQAFFQPKFNLITGDVDSMEVLARWQHPRYGLLCPADFLPLLNGFRLMDELFFSQLEQGLVLLRKTAATGRRLNLAFNLQAEQFCNPILVTRIKELIEIYQISASCLTFEITESSQIETSPTVLENLIRLRMMGAGLSIDDFGVGFSSLERLCQLPFTEIKLDASFIRDLDINPRNRAIVENILSLGSALKMTVVMEGVETEAQRQLLIKLGCSLAQGYLCARPMSAIGLLAWLELKRAFINSA
ncbi:EAL domain-containing response regulator [Pseudomonas sp. 1912-s]|uniref:EAL domain-containing response regulator n=1 Tax=Pseudomonas sp. 1912-s TaxID=3033802 RepID=UPI0023DFCFCD|nr:EAL domain-containing response regulator [Pseudomonas sp. 1912-s]MDF3201795.1 EAL domain-containing response regulator [Pseudomonas sp. 1912-s]